MEHGEIDLSERLRNLKGGMDENLLRVIWTQMLQAVDAIHRMRTIHGHYWRIDDTTQQRAKNC